MLFDSESKSESAITNLWAPLPCPGPWYLEFELVNSSAFESEPLYVRRTTTNQNPCPSTRTPWHSKSEFECESERFMSETKYESTNTNPSPHIGSPLPRHSGCKSETCIPCPSASHWVRVYVWVNWCKSEQLLSNPSAWPSAPSPIFLVLEQVIGTTLALQLCNCDCLTIERDTVNDGTRF